MGKGIAVKNVMVRLGTGEWFFFCNYSGKSVKLSDVKRWTFMD